MEKTILMPNLSEDRQNMACQKEGENIPSPEGGPCKISTLLRTNRYCRNLQALAKHSSASKV